MKGHDVLLRALAQVDGLHLEILGEGDYRPQLKRLAADLGIAHRVELPGWVDHPAAQISRFDVVVQPSRSEGFPLTVVEAMLASRPIIATRVGSVAEAILDGETGLLIEKDQVGQLAGPAPPQNPAQSARSHRQSRPHLRLRPVHRRPHGPAL